MEVNKAGADWLLIKQFLTAEIEAAKSRLTDRGQTFDDTMFERGQVAAYKKLLAHVEREGPPAEEDVNYG